MNARKAHTKALISLAMGAFGIALTEFVIMGILPEVAGSLQVTIPEAGHFIAAYALGVVIGAPVLAGISHRWTSRQALMALMVWFTVFNALSGLASNYAIMLALRFLSGLPHGAFFGIGAVIAARLSREGREAQGIAKMFVGFTLANVIGVPLGTYIGNVFHWSLSFALIGGVGLLTVASLYAWMPEVSTRPSSADNQGMNRSQKRELVALLALTAIGTGGFFAWYSYIAPLLIDVAGLAPAEVSYAMILAGLGMVAGNMLGAKMVEWFSPVRAIVVGMSGMSAMLLFNSFMVSDPAWALFLCFAIGLVTFTLAAPIQMAIIDASRGSEMLASSWNQSAFNIANANGAYLAGLPIAYGFGVVAAGRVGAALAALGAAMALAIWLRKRSRRLAGSRKSPG
ncbi:MAG TPA: MFS transporter [Robiginitalea sp.]|nr:MFS transporter [Robiginitalea sp.]